MICGGGTMKLPKIYKALLLGLWIVANLGYATGQGSRGERVVFNKRFPLPSGFGRLAGIVYKDETSKRVPGQALKKEGQQETLVYIYQGQFKPDFDSNGKPLVVKPMIEDAQPVAVVETDVAGYFQLDVKPGVYSIFYETEGNLMPIEKTVPSQKTNPYWISFEVSANLLTNVNLIMQKTLQHDFGTLMYGSIQ